MPPEFAITGLRLDEVWSVHRNSRWLRGHQHDRTDSVRTHLAEGDKEPVDGSPAEFMKFIAADAERLRAQVKISGANAD